MKKKLFFKFFVLAAMALFTITACQNDDVDAPGMDNNEAALQEAIRQLDGLKATLDDITTARIKADHEEFAVLKQRFEANPGDEALQTGIIAKAVHIEALTSFQTRAVGTYPTVPSTATPNIYTDGLSASRGYVKDYYNTIVNHLAALRTFIEANIDGGSVDLGPLTTRVQALENTVATLATKAELNAAVSTLNTTINTLSGELNAKITILNTLLGIAGAPPASSVLDEINAELIRLEDVKANKFTIEQTVYDLKDVYDELIAITDALDIRLTQAEADIVDLQERVTYIEEVELPAIWEGISILYEYIGDVYNNLDQRVTGLTFKPDYDFGPGLSSLILVRGISEWESETVEGGFGW